MDDQQYMHYHHAGSAQSPSSSWTTPAQVPVSASSPAAYPPTMYAMPNRSAEHVEYAAPSQSTSFVQHPQAVYAAQDPCMPSASERSMAITISLSQIDSNIGPSRVLTRRQARAQMAALQQGRQGDGGVQSVQDGSHDTNPQGVYYADPSGTRPHDPAASRPHTPSSLVHAGSYAAHQQQLAKAQAAVLGNGVPPPGNTAVSPSYPSTPLSSSSAYSPYSFFRHSRSASNATSNPRSASPALSIASALTSISSASAPSSRNYPNFPGTPLSMSPTLSREKQKKQKLLNVDRRDICQYHLANPNARQEDIAAKWQVERSTISKILKHKTKWLNVPTSDEQKVAQHKPSKFPEIEREMENWLMENKEKGGVTLVLSDQLLRSKAKEIAKDLQIPDEKFKASSGWVENFKHRHGIRRGVWGLDAAESKDGASTPLEDVKGEPSGELPSNCWFKPSSNGQSIDGTSDVAMRAESQEADSSLEVASHGSHGSHSSHSVEASPQSSLRPPWQPQGSPLSNGVHHSHHQASPTSSLHEIHRRSSAAMSALQGTDYQHSLLLQQASQQMQMDVGQHMHMQAMHNAQNNQGSFTPPEAHQHLHHDQQLNPVSVRALTSGYSAEMGFQVGMAAVGEVPRDSELVRAEESMSFLLRYLDTHPEGSLVTSEERATLAQIKCKLLSKAGNSLPYHQEKRDGRVVSG